MIGGKDNDGVIGQALPHELVADSAHDDVDTGDQAVVIFDRALKLAGRSEADGPAIAVHAVLDKVGEAIEVLCGGGVRLGYCDITVEIGEGRIGWKLI